MTQLQVVRRAAFITMPWRNGGGITHEVLRAPAAVAGAAARPFTWRVSIAEIGSAGPFSAFPDHRRIMVLLQGEGVELGFPDGRGRQLRRIGDWLEFDGALATECRLLGGPCTDLNLMVAKDHSVEARVCSPLQLPGLSVASGETALLVGLTAPLTLVDATGARTGLEPWELAVLSQGSVQIASTQDFFVATLRGGIQ